MSHPSPPEAPTPGSRGDAPADRRRIRVAGGQLLHREAETPGPHPSGRPPSAPLPVEMTGVFRQLQDTAEALSQRLERLSVDAPAGPLPPASDPRPLPMHQRRPHRVEPGQVNPKRSVRFASPGELLPATSLTFPAVEADASPETDVLPETVHGVPELPGLSPSTRLDRPPGSVSPSEPFQPRRDYTPVEEEDNLTAPGRGWGLGWGLVTGAFALGLASGWAFHRFSVPGTVSAPAAATAGVAGDPGLPTTSLPADPLTTARATVLVNQALRAEKSGDSARAADLFTEAGRVCPTFRGIHYRLALLSLRQGEKNKARTLLARSLAAGEEVAAVHQILSALARLENQPELGFAELEDATRADPFNPRYLYYWAEALRRAGRLPEAREKLEDAVIRSADPTEEPLYRLKLRLVEIELNQEDEFTGELLAHTHDAVPAPPEWLLTAAALDLKHGDYVSAATYLTRARQILPMATATFLFNDQTFLDHAWRPELAPFYAPEGARVPTTSPGPVAGMPVGSGTSTPGLTGGNPRPPRPVAVSAAPDVRSRPKAP